MRRKLVLIILLATFMGVFASTTNSYATNNDATQEENLHITRWYKVYWLGMHVANLITEVKEQEDGIINIESHINAKGIAKKVSKYWSVTKSATKKTKDGAFIPHEFDSTSRLRKKKRSIAIDYVESGTINTEQVTPPDNRLKRPAVDNQMKSGAVDPHTAILVAHKEIRNAINKGKIHFTIPLYDARRLSNLNFEIKGRKRLKHNDRIINVIHIHFYREAVAGYTNNEKKRMKDENPVIDMYLEDNELLLPVKAIANAPIGSATAVLERECYDISSCETTPASYAYAGSIPW